MKLKKLGRQIHALFTYWGARNQAHPIGNPLYEFYKNVEFKIFRWFLIRYCAYELDQFDSWEVSTKYGPVYIQISRQSDGYKYDRLN